MAEDLKQLEFAPKCLRPFRRKVGGRSRILCLGATVCDNQGRCDYGSSGFCSPAVISGRGAYPSDRSQVLRN